MLINCILENIQFTFVPTSSCASKYKYRTLGSCKNIHYYINYMQYIHTCNAHIQVKVSWLGSGNLNAEPNFYFCQIYLSLFYYLTIHNVVPAVKDQTPVQHRMILLLRLTFTPRSLCNEDNVQILLQTSNDMKLFQAD